MTQLYHHVIEMHQKLLQQLNQTKRYDSGVFMI